MGSNIANPSKMPPESIARYFLTQADIMSKFFFQTKSRWNKLIGAYARENIYVSN